MSADWCQDCETHHFGSEKCYPVFELFYEDWYGDEWYEIRGLTMNHAVERWAAEADSSGDYTIVGQSHEPLVRVRPKGSSDEKLLKVIGESVPSYCVNDAALCTNAECTSKGDRRAQRSSDGLCDNCWHRNRREERENAKDK